MPAKTRFLCLLPLLLLFGYGIKRSLSAPGSDFAGYYAGSREIVHGRYPNTYDLRTLNAIIRGDGYNGNFVSYAPFPPFTAFVFAPFLFVSMGVAKVVFNLLSCAAFLLTLWRCSRFFSVEPWLVFITPIVFFIPIVNNLVFGQAYLLLCSLLLEGFIAYREERKAAAAAYWGFAILFKLTPAFLFLFLILRKKYRQAGYLAVACGILLSVSLLVTGIDVWRFYISDILPKMGRGELNDPFTYIFQSAFMLLKRLFLYDGLFNPHPVYYSPYLFVFLMALFKALILVPTILLSWRWRDDLFPFAVWIAASMLISPNGSSYSLVLLLIPLWAFIPMGRVKAGAAALLLGVACTVAVGQWGRYPVWGQFPRLYLLLLFFALLLAQGRRKWNGWLVLGLTGVFFGLEIRNYLPVKDDSRYLLTKEDHLFIYDYAVKDHRLVYYYEDDKGSKEQVTPMVVGGLTGEGVEMRGNQIWYQGRQLTDSPDWKKKPMVLDGETVVYLSDKNRGMAFIPYGPSA